MDEKIKKLETDLKKARKKDLVEGDDGGVVRTERAFLTFSLKFDDRKSRVFPLLMSRTQRYDVLVPTAHEAR